MAEDSGDTPPGGGEDEVRPLRWSARWSLTTRILAVNVLAIALLAGGVFYLDTYRLRLVDQQRAAMSEQTALLARAIEAARPEAKRALIADYARQTASRVRLYRGDGTLASDSFALAGPTYELRDPAQQSWYRGVARALDRGFDWIVGAEIPDDFVEPDVDRLAAWPEAVAARAGRAQLRLRYAPDRTPVLSSAQPLRGGDAAVLLVTDNAREITRTVRAERFRLGVVVAVVTLASVLLSLFLARTIVDPLRRLARAAVRVRLGRARDVVVPRLPSRRDEIGTLARAVSDMTHALRERIDAGEHFAADVTHELKNPIASLRSAIEGLERVDQPALRDQLLAIARDDVRRIDRLVTDISEASRLDAQLSRARFERVDLGPMIEAMLAARRARGDGTGPNIAFARPRRGVAEVMGDARRLERAIDNLVDNALSFSPQGGLVCIRATRLGDAVHIRVEDEGPGIDPAQRESVFRRFHSDRPDGEDFGRHSGLGLAIARAIVEGHLGSISAQSREDGARGASLLIVLPAAPDTDLPV